jgi:hypothetical protein
MMMRTMWKLMISAASSPTTLPGQTHLESRKTSNKNLKKVDDVIYEF